MKIKVFFQEKSLDCTLNDEITNLSQVSQKLCSLFLLTNYYSYSLFLSNGQLIDNINLVEDGSEIIIKHLNKLSNTTTTVPISIPNTNTIAAIQQQSSINGGVSISPNTPNTPNNIIGTPNSTTTTGISIDNLLINLKDNVFKKKAFFDLKDLKEESLIKKFVEKNGIELIVEQLKELTGNTLSYALSALVTIMSYDFGIPTSLTDITSLITQILPMTENTSNPSICKTSLSLLCIFLNQAGNNVNFKQFSTSIIKDYNEKNGGNYIGNTLVQLLSSSNTVDVQLNSLTLLNIIIGKTLLLDGELAFNDLLAQLDQKEINLKLKKLVEQIIAPELKRQLFIYQRHRFQLITNRKNVTFNKESAEHDALLTKLWTLTYPGVKLESKVSEQWKLMGFQGTDPCTDFRAMGIWGLDNLIYFAQNHNEKFKKIINSQTERKDREYPTATAGIVITFELYNSIFKIGSNINPHTTPVDDLPFFPLFFSHPHAFEEVYCTTFQILDSTWDDMNGTYMHFQKIMSSVKNLIITALESKPTTLEAFDWKCQKNTKNSGGSNNSNSLNHLGGSNNQNHNGANNNKDNPDIKRLLNIINKEVLDTIKLQKTQYLLEGFQFKLAKPLKTKQSLVLSWIFVRLSHVDDLMIQYCFLPFELQQLPSPQNSLMTNFNTIKINDIQINETGNSGNSSGGTNNNSNSGTGGINIGGGKKKDKSNSIQFSISIKDDQFQNLVQNQQPPTLINNGNNNNNSGGGCNSPSLDGGSNNSNNINNNNNNNNNGTPNLGSLNTTSPMMIPQSSSSSSILPISSPSSPILSSHHMMGSSPLQQMQPPLSSSSSSSSSSSTNSNNIDLVGTNKEDLSNFWDAIRLLSGLEIKSPEGVEDYQSLLSINTSVRLLDLDGIDIPKDIPTIPTLPENFDFRS